MTTERKGGWTQTFSGKQFWGMDAKVEDIHLIDIAHALSNVNRYNGHTPIPYSVAHHSVLVSKECDPVDAFWGLMHDASEAYIGDMISPLKRFNPIYLEVEDKLMRVICDRFGMDYKMPESVKKADLTVLAAEARDFFPVEKRPDDWKLPYPPADIPRIHPLPWYDAKTLFLGRFLQLRPDLVDATARAAIFK